MGYLILALRFLTIVPVPGAEAAGAGALGRAAWWFPVVGFAIGAGLVAVDRLMASAFPPLLGAILLVAVWKILTGGLHLDGLADAIDGIAGRDPERRIAIMRDSHLGAFGAVGLGLCLLISVGALDAVPAVRRPAVLLLAPAIGRLAPVLIGPLFPAATPGQGSGAAFLEGLSPWATPVHVAWLWILAAALFGPWGGILMSLALAPVLLWGVFLASRLGGLTGDALGGSVEIGEMATLTAAAALMHVQLI
jgi:adenosylcobinamide-GDP ribazoletransferase